MEVLVFEDFDRSKEALSTERWNRLHPTEPARTPYVTELLRDSEGPIVAVSDYMRVVPEMIARSYPCRIPYCQRNNSSPGKTWPVRNSFSTANRRTSHTDRPGGKYESKPASFWSSENGRRARSASIPASCWPHRQIT